MTPDSLASRTPRLPTISASPSPALRRRQTRSGKPASKARFKRRAGAPEPDPALGDNDDDNDDDNDSEASDSSSSCDSDSSSSSEESDRSSEESDGDSGDRDEIVASNSKASDEELPRVGKASAATHTLDALDNPGVKRRKTREEWSPEDVHILVSLKFDRVQNALIAQQMTAINGRDNVAISNKWKQLKNQGSEDAVFLKYLGYTRQSNSEGFARVELGAGGYST